MYEQKITVEIEGDHKIIFNTGTFDEANNFNLLLGADSGVIDFVEDGEKFRVKYDLSFFNLFLINLGIIGILFLSLLFKPYNAESLKLMGILIPFFLVMSTLALRKSINRFERLIQSLAKKYDLDEKIKVRRLDPFFNIGITIFLAGVYLFKMFKVLFMDNAAIDPVVALHSILMIVGCVIFAKICWKRDI